MTSSNATKLVQITAAGLVGVLLGAVGMSVLRAQTTATPAYLVGNTQEVLDPEMLKQYTALVGKTGVSYGARMIAQGKPLPTDASTLPRGSFVIIQFPSMKNLQDWWNSPEYAAVRPLREKSTVGQTYVLEGVPAS